MQSHLSTLFASSDKGCSLPGTRKRNNFTGLIYALPLDTEGGREENFTCVCFFSVAFSSKLNSCQSGIFGGGTFRSLSYLTLLNCIKIVKMIICFLYLPQFKKFEQSKWSYVIFFLRTVAYKYITYLVVFYSISLFKRKIIV